MTWTQAARQHLEDYLARTHATLDASGADANEVVDDLRSHIDEELAAAKIELVTEDDLRRILSRLGPAAADKAAPPAKPSSAPAETATSARRKPLLPGLLFFGVVLPAVTLGVELWTHMCAGVLFEPLPTFWHVALVALVPLANALGWWAVRERKQEWRSALGWLNGVALGVAFAYSILFLPFMPYAAVGLLFFGFGLMPLAPALSFALAWRCRVLLRQLPAPSTPSASQFPSPARLPGLWPGFGLAVAALALFIAPVLVTRHWMRQAAAADEPARHLSAVRWLRSWGHEATMLKDCYGTSRGMRESTFWSELLERPVPPELARTLYFRVTGDEFNSVPPPQLGFARGGWEWMEDFAWDADHGGDAVAGRIKGLSLAQSRLDGLLNADAAWAYVEWTMEFKNASRTAREARAQIGLPPGACVSRLTLWVNGEEREAAFAGRSEVRKAYQDVAVVQRRDPVLVTSAGPDRVLMQCFPVPADGGTMKVRVGITVPLQLPEAGQAALPWPCFFERNFNLPEGLEHSVWLESPQPVQSTCTALRQAKDAKGRSGLRGLISNADLSGDRGLVTARRTPGADQSWVADHMSQDGAFVVQQLQSKEGARPGRVIFVIDGSRGMRAFRDPVADALEKLPEGTEFAVLLARDQVEDFSGGLKRASGPVMQELARRLRRASCEGGQDNTAALVRGWDLATEDPTGVVVWVHGPQAVLLDHSEALQQRLDWCAGSGRITAPVLLDLQTRTGPNRIAEKFDGANAFTSVPRFGDLSGDLGRLLKGWGSSARTFEVVRARHVQDVIPVANRGQSASKHITRLWAYNEALRLIASRRRPEAIELAARYQLVTPASGAVVLESQQQYQQAGLQPVAANTVPMVPEPGGLLALAALMGAGVVWWRRRQRARDVVRTQT